MKSAEPCLPAAQKNCQHHAGRGAKPGRNGYFCYFECEDCAHLVLECLNLDASQHKYRRTKPGKRAHAIVLRTLRLPLPNTPGTNFPVSWEKTAPMISWAPRQPRSVHPGRPYPESWTANSTVGVFGKNERFHSEKSSFPDTCTLLKTRTGSRDHTVSSRRSFQPEGLKRRWPEHMGPSGAAHGHAVTSEALRPQQGSHG